jgi:hypothetical protein
MKSGPLILNWENWAIMGSLQWLKLIKSHPSPTLLATRNSVVNKGRKLKLLRL